MTTDVGVRLSIADALGRLMKDGLPFRFEAFDGSVGGPEDAPITMRLLNERGLADSGRAARNDNRHTPQ